MHAHGSLYLREHPTAGASGSVLGQGHPAIHPDRISATEDGSRQTAATEGTAGHAAGRGS